MRNIFSKIKLNWFKRAFPGFIKHKYKIILFLIILLFAALLFARINPTLLYTPDSSVYLILANSFLPGHEVYHDYSIPGNPVHILYPPMYPLLLAPAAFFFGESILAAKAISVIWAILMLVGLYFLFKKCCGRNWALVVIALTAVSPVIITFSTEVMSEITALMFAVYSLLFVIKFNEEKKKRYLLFSALMAVAAFLSRSIWVAIVPALALYLLFNKKWKSAIIIFILSIALMVPWVARDHYAAKAIGMRGGGYIEQIKNMDLTPEGPTQAIRLIKRVGSNIGYYYEHIGRMTNTLFFSSSYSPPAYSQMFFRPLGARSEQIILIITLFLILLGLVRALYLNNKTRLIALAVLGHFFLLMIFPYKEVRYMVPLIPFCLYFLASGLTLSFNSFFLIPRFRVKLKRGIINIFLLVALFIFLLPNFLINYHKAHMNFYNLIWPGAIKEALANDYIYDWGSELIGIGKWIRKNTPEDSVILQDRKELYFYAQRPIILSEPVTQLTVEEFNWMIWGNDINYIIEEKFFDKSPLDTKRLGSQQYDIMPEVSVGSLTAFKVKEKLFQKETENEDYQEVLGALEGAVANNPGNFAVLNNLGVFYLKNEQQEEALVQFQKSIALDSTSAQIHFNLATAYLDNEMYDEAEKEYNIAKQIQFVHRLVPLIKSNLQIIELLRVAEKAEDKDTKVDFYNQVAIIYYSRGKYDQVQKYLAKALELDSDSALTNTGLGRIHEALGHYEESLKFYEKAQKLDPQDKTIDPFTERTKIARILRHEEKGVLEINNKETKIDFEEAESYNILGVLYWQTGEPMRAIAFFKKTIELDDKFFFAYENLGMVYEGLGKIEKAKENYKKAVELNPIRGYSKQRLEALEGIK